MKVSELLENGVEVSNTFLKGFDKIVNKDDLRPVMQGVYFDKGCAVATDAHKLVKASLKLYCVDGTNILDGYFLNGAILKEIKPKKGESIVITKGKITIHKNDMIVKELTLQLMDEVGTYPNYEAVIPTEIQEVASIGINGNFLADVQNVYKKAGDNIEHLTVNMHGETRAVTLGDGKGLFLGLVMPYRTY